MSSRAASRIVIGVGLAVVFGTGVALILEQGTQNQTAAPEPAAGAAPFAQTPANPPAAPDAAASLRDTPPGPQGAAASATANSSPPPATNAANQAPLASASGANPGGETSSASSNDTSPPKPKHASRHAQTTAAVMKPENTNSESGADMAAPSSPPATNDAAGSSDIPSAPVAEPTPASGADTDGQITAQVRSSIANLAPGSSVDVKATSGVVALAGSVPSQDVFEQARQAAQQVPGVKQVDTSALLVQNR